MHAQAWSTVAGAVLVFGGRTGSDSQVTNDLWALHAFPGKRGSFTWKWVLQQPAGTWPPARARHGMAEILRAESPYRGRIVIYGGWDSTGTALADTWLYNPADNTYQLLPNAGIPTPRHGFAMGYSPSLDAVIIQGGQTNLNMASQTFTDETWAFDDASLSWVQVTVNSPGTNRSYHDLATDTCGDSAIMFDQPSAGQLPLQPTWILK
jgi:hypothetical protein